MQPIEGGETCALDEFVSPFDCYPEGYQILAEDDDWFIGKMTMKAGAQDPPHSHLDHLVRAPPPCERVLLCMWCRAAQHTAAHVIHATTHARDSMAWQRCSAKHLVDAVGAFGDSLSSVARRTAGVTSA